MEKYTLEEHVKQLALYICDNGLHYTVTSHDKLENLRIMYPLVKNIGVWKKCLFEMSRLLFSLSHENWRDYNSVIIILTMTNLPEGVQEWIEEFHRKISIDPRSVVPFPKEDWDSSDEGAWVKDHSL